MVSAGLWFPILNTSVSDAGAICSYPDSVQFRTCTYGSMAGAPKLFPENYNALQLTLDIQYLIAGDSLLCLPTFTFATYGHVIIRIQTIYNVFWASQPLLLGITSLNNRWFLVPLTLPCQHLQVITLPILALNNFLSSSELEASSSPMYASTTTQPRSDWSMVLMCFWHTTITLVLSQRCQVARYPLLSLTDRC